jgi:hypothetical protein
MARILKGPKSVNQAVRPPQVTPSSRSVRPARSYTELGHQMRLLIRRETWMAKEYRQSKASRTASSIHEEAWQPCIDHTRTREKYPETFPNPITLTPAPILRSVPTSNPHMNPSLSSPPAHHERSTGSCMS